MKSRSLYISILMATALLIGGCATRHQVRVDALSSGQGAAGRGLTYEFASATPGVEEGDLFFKEVCRFLEPVLSAQRFYPANEGDAPNLLIEVDAHLSEPMTETESYSEPIYMESGGHFRTVTVPVVSSDGQVTYTYRSYWIPSRTRVAGWVDNNRQVTVYDKILRLSAREVLDDGSYTDEVWAISIVMRDEGTDYRASLAYMLVAAGPYIGKRTEGEEIILIRHDSDEVEAFRAGVLNGG